MRTRVIAATLMVLVACSPSKDQTTSGTPASAQLPTGTLDQLLAPIALYPDALLAQILMSAQNPPKVAELDQWLKSNPNLKATQLQDAAVKAGFDASYVALALFPQVVAKMAEQIAWTVVLGQSFTNDKTAVFAAIQKLRKQAQSVGTLKSTPQQDVETKTISSGEQVIVIEPANPQVIYVPQYNTQTVYTQAPTATYTQPPATSTTTVIVQEDNDTEVALAAGLIGFTAGIAIGAAMNNNYYYSPYGYGWGYHGGGYMYAQGWDDYYDARDDARDDWMDHREDLAEERTDRFEDRQDQRTDRTETRQEQRTDRQENRPEATQAQRDQVQQRAQERQAQGGSAQQRAQERQAQGGSAQQRTQERQAQGASAQGASAQGVSAQGASAQSASQRSRTGSAEARGYGGETARTQASSQRSSDAFSGYSSGSSQRAASSRGQQSRSSASSRSGGRRR